MKQHQDSHSTHDKEHQTIGFFYRKDVIRWFLRIFYFCCAALLIADFIIHRHIVTDIERIPTFYAIYGLISCVVLVYLAKWLRILLIRDENYYDEPETADDFLTKQGLESPTTYAKESSDGKNKEKN